MRKEDKTLRTHVLDELDWTSSIDADDIGVAVSDGVATLTGHVSSFAQKRSAERAAFRVAGVRGVANDLEVRLPDEFERSDTDITKAAVRAINWHTQLPTKDIDVSVDNGWVTLAGTVHWNYQRKRAEQAVRFLTGVRGVSNKISVRARPMPSDVRSRIRTALERQAGQEADRLSISVEDGTVTLTGRVQSRAERDDVEKAVWSAPGVTTVRNRLKVESEAFAY
jgi:osmotically-inducible protein OsmY